MTGYEIVDDDEGYGKALLINASWSSRYLDLIAARGIKIIRLNDRVGWSDSDVSFLGSIPSLNGVDIISDKVTDVSPIFQLKQLKTLSLYCKASVKRGHPLRRLVNGKKMSVPVFSSSGLPSALSNGCEEN